MRRIYLITFVLLSLSACTTPPADGIPHPYENYLNEHPLTLPQSDELQSCSGYGCAFRDRV